MTRWPLPPRVDAWGKNDPIFLVPGARAYLGHLPKAQLHFYDTGHFAIEEDTAAIAPTATSPG